MTYFFIYLSLFSKLYSVNLQSEKYVVSADDVNYHAKNYKKIEEQFNLDSTKTLVIDFGQTKQTPDSFGYSKETGKCKIPENVKKVIIRGGNLEIIGDMFLFSCKNIQEVIVENPIKEIQSDFLSENTQLIRLHLPNSLQKIGNSFLDGCSSLSSLEIASSLAEIGDNFLRDCSSLVRFQLSDQLIKIGNNFMQRCNKIRNISMPHGIEEIGDHFLEGADELETIELPQNLKKVGNVFLKNCIKLKTVKIPKNVDEIGNYFLFGNKNLTTLFLPDVLLTIPEGFLGQCVSLRKIKITYNSPAYISLVFVADIDERIKILILENKK